MALHYQLEMFFLGWDISCLPHLPRERMTCLPGSCHPWPTSPLDWDSPSLHTPGWCSYLVMDTHWSVMWVTMICLDLVQLSPALDSSWQEACKRNHLTQSQPRTCPPASLVHSRKPGQIFSRFCQIFCKDWHTCAGDSFLAIIKSLNVLRWQSQFQRLSIRNTCCRGNGFIRHFILSLWIHLALSPGVMIFIGWLRVATIPGLFIRKVSSSLPHRHTASKMMAAGSKQFW